MESKSKIENLKSKIIRVLVVDDEWYVLDSISELLIDAGFEVATAVSGKDALKKLGENRFDIALVDIKMPGMDGIELLNRVREEYPDVSVIMITGYATVSNAVEAVKAGAYDFIRKPFDNEKLKVSINRLLEKRKLEEECKRAEEELRIYHEELEIRVQERTAELKELNEQLKIEIEERKQVEKNLLQETEVTANLLMIAHATTHITDIDKLLEQVIYCGQKIMGCDICFSYLWDRETKVFRPRHAYGLSHEQKPFFKAGSLNEEAEFVEKALEGRWMVVEQFGVKSSEFGVGAALHWMKNIDTAVIIPLFIREEKLGLIIAAYKKHREFSERDKKIIQGISHQVSAALEQARLYRDSINRAMELGHKIETIRFMHDIDKAILSTLDPDVILETAFIQISKIIPCDRVAVALVDEEKGGLIYKAGLGVTFLQKGTFIPFKDTSAADAIKTGRPQYVANLEKVKDILPIEKRLLEEGFLSHIRVPLIVKGEVIGLLIIGARRPAAFTPENLLTLEKMAFQVGIALENARLLTDLEELFLGTVKTLSSAIDAKSTWTAGHSERVTRYALGIGKEMGLSERELKDLELAGILHDIGKIGTYEGILDKPGKLSNEEMAIVRAHPAAGASIISPIKQLKGIIPSVRHHHENYDGTGYPDKLKGEEIPLFARILAVADTYDAMKADRPYRSGRTMDFIIAEFRRCSGTQFDPKVVEAFLKVLAD